MQRFLQIFKHKKCNIIGMIHVNALPGTPQYKRNWLAIIDKVKYEAHIYKKYKLDSVLIENMHDIPYVNSHDLNPETIACMTRICHEVNAIINKYNGVTKAIPVGLQVLAMGNQQAMAIAKACQVHYIRVENFVFSHIADEGFCNGCAGDLLRYRNRIDANDVLVFSDVKKKHGSHTITQDITLLEMAKAAEFFLTDGIIVTGKHTGDAPNAEDVLQLQQQLQVPLIVGSGITSSNISMYFNAIQAAIVGSHFKQQGHWANELSEPTIQQFMQTFCDLRNQSLD